MAADKQIVMEVLTNDNKHHGWVVFCPACETGHLFDSRWTFNGDMMKPTFRASMLVDYGLPEKLCHSFVTDGMIQFLDDCGHALRGKTVPLEAIY